jgi:multicomponent Na+:H+ antiporter subunit D
MMIHPGLVLFLTAVIVPFVRGTARRVVLAAGTVAALISWESLDFTSGWQVSVGEYSLTLLHVDPLSLVFSLIFTIVTFVGILYALHNDSAGEQVSTLIYAGSSLGVVLAGDWATLFVFWELMAVSSLFLIWQSGTERSARAGYRYLLVHIFGGSLLFAGILVHLARGGEFAITALTASDTDPLAFWLILLGVAINAAIPPLHAWLTDAYPEASVTGSVFLSAFTTKTAVYVLLRLFPGADVLVWAGVAMALYGVVYAVLENDIRRLLAYHIISQVGYMVAGVGMGTDLALNGATAHAFSHILYKSVLFMGMGAVIYATGLRKLTELGGIADRMKLVVILYAVGACSISGFPLFNGFISKSMIISAAAESHLPIVELLLTLASIGTFLHTGLKLPYFTFFGPKKDLELRPLPLNMLVAMGVGAILCTLYGVVPSLLYGLLPFGAEYHPYTLDHVVSAYQLLAGTAIAFWLLIGKLGGEATVSVDTDWFYRRPFKSLIEQLVAAIRSAGQSASMTGRTLIAYAWAFSQAPTGAGKRPDNPQAEDYDPYRFRFPIGMTVFWVVVYFALVAITALL